MMNKFLSIGLIGLLIIFADSPFVLAQRNAANDNTNVEKIKKKYSETRHRREATYFS